MRGFWLVGSADTTASLDPADNAAAPAYLHRVADADTLLAADVDFAALAAGRADESA